MEVIVVLVITSLISVVLVQGLGLVLAARTSVQNKIVGIERLVMQRNIFLNPLRGILPDYPDRPHIFAGDARRIHGLTVRPLQSRIGTPVGFTLSMDYDTSRDQMVLTYQEQGTEAREIGRWDGRQGAFAYRDRAGEWRDAWPSKDDPTAPQTPWLIRLSMGTSFPSTLIASVAGAHQRILRMQDTPMGGASLR
jgi:general secretion pathway protein J